MREPRLKKVEEKSTDAQWGHNLTLAQRGDKTAYRAFLEAITPFARALARKRVWDQDGIEDIVQDVLLTVHRVRHTYEPGRPIKPWLAAIIARRSIDAMRKRGRIGAQEVHNELAYETFADPRANQTEAGDNARTLAHMMDDLTPRQREALELVKLREMSLQDASAQSGQSATLLKVNIHRAIKKMRLTLRQDGADE